MIGITNLNKNNFKDWLIDHPEINPYKFSLGQLFRNTTKRFRKLPEFLVIGGAKCGTTSLFSYILQHPKVVAPTLKEVHFFEYISKTNESWYRMHFPIKKNGIVTGEATPGYLVHPFVPERVHKIIPNVKLIIILRNPVDRAYSAFNYMMNLGTQIRTDFENVINEEISRMKLIEGNPEFEISDRNYDYTLTYSYLRHGIYVNYIKNWFRYFPKEQFFMLHSKELSDNTNSVMQKIFGFLQLPNYNLNDFENKKIRKIFSKAGNELDNENRFNVQSYPKMKEETRKSLLSFFKPYNEELFKFIGKRFEWDV